MNFQHPFGKVVYYIPKANISFENSKDKRDGKQQAEQYCLDNFIDPNSIIKFDSRVERDRYVYLLDLQQQGLIRDLTHHFTFKIMDGFANANGDEIEPITYESDFSYFDNQTNKRVVEDTKGSTYFLDDKFFMLKKIFDYFMKDKNIYLKVILKSKDGWNEYKLGDKKKSQTLIKKQRQEIKELRQEKHEHEMAENKKQREIKRLNELRSKVNLTQQQKNRLNELETKYKI